MFKNQVFSVGDLSQVLHLRLTGAVHLSHLTVLKVLQNGSHPILHPFRTDLPAGRQGSMPRTKIFD